jgi:signal transduction histidine kinase
MTLTLDRETRSAPRMGLLAATLAHEIRNPLASISTNGETLRVLLDADDTRTRYVDAILGEVERLETLVASVLRFAGRKKLLRRDVALGDVASDVLATFDSHASRQGVDLRLEGECPVVPGDRDLIERALDNLIRNALDAMPHGGRLTIRLGASADGGAALLVEDTGPGLPDDDAVFEPFFTTRTRGVGLGLPLARQIAERHGGRLIARSTPGAGTSFRLELPGEER